VKIFRIVIECDVEDDFDLVFGAVNGIEHFSDHVHFAIELVETFDPEESDGDIGNTNAIKSGDDSDGE
jgi:hypothetical protein